MDAGKNRRRNCANKSSNADAKAGVRLSEVARQVPASEVDRITGRLPPTQVNLNFIKTLEKIPGSIPAPAHPEFDVRGLGEVQPTWYVDELRKRPFPIPDPKDAALISSEPSDFSLEGQPKSYGRFQTQRPTLPNGFGEVLTAYSREVVRYQVRGVEMNLFSAIFFRELVRMRGISFRDQLKYDIELEELRKERDALLRGKIYRGRTGISHLANAHKHQDFETLMTNLESSSSSSSNSTASSSSPSTPINQAEVGEMFEDDVVGEEKAQSDKEDAKSGDTKSVSASVSDGDGKSGAQKDPGEAVAKEFRDVLAEKEWMEREYDPDNEYNIPKAKTIVTPGTLKKEDEVSDLICTRETCKTEDSCQVCKDAKCCGDCGLKEEKKSRARTEAQRNLGKKKCKKCGNAIKLPPTLKEQGICEPETCGKELVCGGDCCSACGQIPARCDSETCGEELDCFGNAMGEADIQPDTADESLAMGEHVCKSSTCGNRFREDGEVDESASKCCRMCSKPIAVKCDPSSCGESGEITCEECLRGCCGTAGSNPKCGTCGTVGAGNQACGDCGSGPGGPTRGGVVCGKTVCGKEVECIECGGALCKEETCESSGVVEKDLALKKSGNPKCKKCLKKRLLAADCTKKTCPVCSGAPGRDGKVPTCCKKCVRQESVQDLDNKKSDSEIPPNIKRLVLHGWEADPNADDDDDEGGGGGGKEGTNASKGSPKGTIGGAARNEGEGDIGAVTNAYCVPGNGCRNRCGVCSDCAGKNINNNRVKGGILRTSRVNNVVIPSESDQNVSYNCDVPLGGATCTLGECGKTTLCHKCHGGRDDRPEACPVCHPPHLSCGPGVCQVLIDCGNCCETPPDFKAAFPKLAYSGVGPFQLTVCGPLAGKIAAKKLGLKCILPSPKIEEKADERWFEPDVEAEARRLEKLRQKQKSMAEENFTSERLFGRRLSGAACGVAEWRNDLKEAMGVDRDDAKDAYELASESVSPRERSPAEREAIKSSIPSKGATAAAPLEAPQPVEDEETRVEQVGLEEASIAKSEEAEDKLVENNVVEAPEETGDQEAAPDAVEETIGEEGQTPENGVVVEGTTQDETDGAVGGEEEEPAGPEEGE